MVRFGTLGLSHHDIDAIRQEAMQFAGIGLLTVALDGTIIYADRGLLRIFEVEERYPDVVSAVGLVAGDILGNTEVLTALIESAEAKGRVHARESPITTAKGARRWLLCDAYGLPASGAPFEAVQLMMRDISVRKRTQEQIARLNRCLLRLGADSEANIAALTATAGELLDASAAQYARLSDGMLCAIGRWQMPEGTETVTRPDGHLCYDVIKQGSPEPVVVRDLPSTPYATADPSVARFGLRTYIGMAVRREDEVVGSLCVAYAKDVEPGADDLAMLALLATAIGIEEAQGAARAALKEREETYRSVIEQSLENIYLLDIDTGKVLESNSSLQNLLGYSAEELATLGVEDFVAHEAADIAAIISRVALEGRVFIGERHYRRKDGRIVDVEVSASLVRYHGRRALSVVSRDVTERAKALRALRESEAKYRALVEQSLQGIVVAQNPPTRIVFANEALSQILGYTVAELTALSPEDIRCLVHPEDRAMFFGRFEDRLAGRAAPPRYEFRALRKDGSVRWLEISSSRIEYGGLPAVQAAFIDITSRKQAEESLRLSEARYRTTLDSMSDAIHVVDRELKIILFNAPFRRWNESLGLPVDVIGRSLREVFPFLDQGVEAEYHRVLETGEMLVTEETNDVGGRQIVTETRKIPIVDGGAVIFVVTVIRDITERKRLEEQLRQSAKMEAIGQLAGGVAHDFNNLLTGIIGYASILSRELPEGSRGHHAARTIEATAERASELTRQLLGFARRGKLQVVPVDLHRSIYEVMALLSRTMDPSIRMTLNLNASNATVRGDPAQMHQVLLNLGINARDAMQAGGELTFATDVVDLDEEYCRAHMEAHQGRHVVLSVTDTGHGIPKEIQQRIFEPFFTTKTPGQGTGMGLATVYGIVKNHGGHLEVYSEPGKGATFKVYLPLSPSPDADLPAETPSEPPHGTARILIVDDEEVVRAVAEDLLNELGYRVKTFSRGEDVLRYYADHHATVDLIILDLVMPGMDGRECFAALKAINPGVRALLSTGFGMNGRIQEALDEGMIGFVQKPYRLADLGSKVREALGA